MCPYTYVEAPMLIRVFCRADCSPAGRLGYRQWWVSNEWGRWQPIPQGNLALRKSCPNSTWIPSCKDHIAASLEVHQHPHFLVLQDFQGMVGSFSSFSSRSQAGKAIVLNETDCNPYVLGAFLSRSVTGLSRLVEQKCILFPSPTQFPVLRFIFLQSSLKVSFFQWGLDDHTNLYLRIRWNIYSIRLHHHFHLHYFLLALHRGIPVNGLNFCIIPKFAVFLTFPLQVHSISNPFGWQVLVIPSANLLSSPSSPCASEFLIKEFQRGGLPLNTHLLRRSTACKHLFRQVLLCVPAHW